MRIAALAALGILAAGCSQVSGGGSTRLATQDDSVSYILGYNAGKSMKKQGVPVNAEVLFRGMREGLAERESAIPESLMQGTMMAFQTRMMQQQHHRDSLAGAENREAAEAFFLENAKKDGVRTTSSGLQYKVEAEGSGPHPTPTSSVTVKYRGTLLDGTEFDSSGDNTVTFQVTRVIPGWTEGLQLMRAGARYTFWIPAELCYGLQGSPPRIPPNAALKFEVELVSFK
ncbi:MAG: FKBP-type peptidyl-prolyl cis-trans isomerase [Gemmatimonadales bacterium]